MRKLIFTAIFFVTVFFVSSVCVNAEVQGFKITSGISADKSSEITFDSVKVISGTAAKGTDISITVYEPYTAADGSVQYTVLRNYAVTVGNTGIFSQSVSLKEGKNYVVVVAKNGDSSSEVRTTINRKNKILQTMLSQSIALPGGSAW
ncbi:MAG TPA: hypothetical protein DCG28_02120 [Lachnospiraceae bacterium]|nr:hypothetical protein [Lachnospiraceae bacterium]